MDPFAYILPPETAQIHCAATGLALFRRPYVRARSAHGDLTDNDKVGHVGTVIQNKLLES
jgi:hypothetical protein